MPIEAEVNTKLSLIFYLITALYIYICIAVIVIIISKCIIYKKNGTRWWYALIPIFNSYVLFKLFWDKNHFFTSIIISASITLISPLISRISLLLFPLSSLLLIVGGIISILYKVILYAKIAKKYNKTDKFVIGMFFLPPVYFMILALNKTTPIQATSPVSKTTTILNNNSSSYVKSIDDNSKQKLFVKQSGLYDIIEKCYMKLGIISPNNPFRCDQNAVKEAVLETGIAMLLNLQEITYHELSQIFEQGWRSVMNINLPNNGEEFDYMAGYLLNNYANDVQNILFEYYSSDI